MSERDMKALSDTELMLRAWALNRQRVARNSQIDSAWDSGAIVSDWFLLDYATSENDQLRQALVEIELRRSKR